MIVAYHHSFSNLKKDKIIKNCSTTYTVKSMTSLKRFFFIYKVYIRLKRPTVFDYLFIASFLKSFYSVLR